MWFYRESFMLRVQSNLLQRIRAPLFLAHHIFLMKKFHVCTYHSGFSNGAKAVDEYITGNVDRRTFTQREGGWFQRTVKIQIMKCIFQGALTSCSNTSTLVSLKLGWSTLCPPAIQTSLVQPRVMHSTFTYKCGAFKQASTSVDSFCCRQLSTWS